MTYQVRLVTSQQVYHKSQPLPLFANQDILVKFANLRDLQHKASDLKIACCIHLKRLALSNRNTALENHH